MARRAVAAAVLACVLAAPAAARAGTQYWVTGRGWGHGIGMSQYGAQGFADARGWTAQQIVTYYYQGTEVTTASAADTSLDVLLTEGRSSVTIASDSSAAKVINGTTTSLADGDTVKATMSGGKVTVKLTHDGSTSTIVQPTTSTTRITGSVHGLFTADNGAYGNHYRGELRLVVRGNQLSVVNHVGLDPYVRGVVPSEMPSSWKPEALKAQALAARSYALATRSSSGYYDLHCDTRSQMYLGIEHEAASTDAAVAATPNQVITYNGTVIPAFFFSTSGGHTASVEDVWGGAPRPYLKGVPDPFEKSPYSSWPEQVSYSPAQLASRLGVPTVRGVRVTVNKSLRADSVTVYGSGSSTTSLSPGTVQYRLGLRSTWFRITKVSIAAATPRVRSGARVKLTGFAPSGAYLWKRVTGAGWVRVARVTKRSGSWSRSVRVRSTTTFQLRVGKRSGPSSRVRV